MQKFTNYNMELTQEDQSFVKEPFFRKIKRVLLSLLLPSQKQLTRLAKDAGILFDFLTDEYPEVVSRTYGQVIFLYDESELEQPLVALVFEPLGKTASLMANEYDDLIGLCVDVKKSLERNGYHVYYLVKPMEHVGGVLAVGKIAIRNAHIMYPQPPAKRNPKDEIN